MCGPDSVSGKPVGFKVIKVNQFNQVINLFWGEMDYRFHAAHLDRGLTIHEAVPGGFNRAGEGL